jgi:hypothetical protein
MLSNLELMRAFVYSSIQKQEVLLSNPFLTAQTVYQSTQVMAKTEGVIAIAELAYTPSLFLVNATSSYWEIMNEVFADYSYILTGELDRRGFYQYRYCQVPNGYEMHGTKSVLLWRAWWKYRKYALQVGIPLELMIRTRDAWYPIRDLNISDGLLYIKTLGNEIAVHADDLVTWLSKTQPNSYKTTNTKILQKNVE